MKVYLLWILCGAFAYLLGSIPFGFLMAKSKGKDIRTLGSGNIGATNVFRSVSKTLGLLTFLCDFLKGVVGTMVIPILGRQVFGIPETETIYLPLLCGVMTVVGHNWTCFLGFKGGKGISTSAGMLLGLAPACVGIAFAVWVVAFLLTRYVSVGSILAAVTLAISVWPMLFMKNHDWVIPIVLTLLAVLAIWKHRSNINRLIHGTESRFQFHKK